jgi:hypothetical protein
MTCRSPEALALGSRRRAGVPKETLELLLPPPFPSELELKLWLYDSPSDTDELTPVEAGFQKSFLQLSLPAIMNGPADTSVPSYSAHRAPYVISTLALSRSL